MFNHPLEMPLLTYKGSFSNGKLQASILESVPFRGLVHHSVPFRRIVPTILYPYIKTTVHPHPPTLLLPSTPTLPPYYYRPPPPSHPITTTCDIITRSKKAAQNGKFWVSEMYTPTQ